MSAHRLSRVVLISTLLLAGAALAQQTYGPIDLSGQWAARNHEDIGDNALPGDYSGMPINDEARARADAWSATNQSMPERQCIMYTSFYTVLGPQPLRITQDIDPISGNVIAWKLSGAIDREPRNIWMDGRAPPSEFQRHSPAGFSSGHWVGDTLVVHTTHLTASLIGRTGVPASDEATLDEYINRHGDALTITMFMYDPVYFEGPYVRSKVWVLTPSYRMLPEPCEPVVELPWKEGTVPHYLPGTNPGLVETTNKFGIPMEAIRGGAVTTYPEYRKHLQDIHAATPAAK